MVLDEEKVSLDLWDFLILLFVVTYSHTVLRFSGDAPYPSTSAHRKDHNKGEGLNPSKDVAVSPEEDERTQLLSQGLTLLLAARERVLTLSEQRVGPFSLPSYLC